MDKLCVLLTLSEESQTLKITGEHPGNVCVGCGKTKQLVKCVLYLKTNQTPKCRP